MSELRTLTLGESTKYELLDMLKSQDRHDKSKAGKVYTEQDLVTLIEELVSDAYSERFYS